MNDYTHMTGFQRVAHELNSIPSAPAPRADIIQDTWDDAMKQVQKEQERIFARESANYEKRFSTKFNRFFHRENAQLGY
jgi:hypothetical protein